MGDRTLKRSRAWRLKTKKQKAFTKATYKKKDKRRGDDILTKKGVREETYFSSE